MSVLLTGSTGFIGSNILKELEKKNEKIILLGRKANPKYKTFDCDFLTDKVPLNAFNDIDTVIHSAGCAHDIDNKILSESYFKINTHTVVEMAKISIQKGVKSFIFISSVKAANPSDIYGMSKQKAERRLLEMSKNSDMQIIIVRPALVYGKKVKGNLELMMNGIKKGWFPPIPETENKRSMIHVDDLVDVIFFLKNFSNLEGGIFIATDGRVYSTAEIYDIFCNILGKKIPKIRVPKLFFTIISFIHPSIKFKVDKLLGNDYYSSEKLDKLGFVPKKTLIDIKRNT